jgi:hypothetical protein
MAPTAISWDRVQAASKKTPYGQIEYPRYMSTIRIRVMIAETNKMMEVADKTMCVHLNACKPLECDARWIIFAHK